jgi:hypothetical protein
MVKMSDYLPQESQMFIDINVVYADRHDRAEPAHMTACRKPVNSEAATTILRSGLSVLLSRFSPLHAAAVKN